MSRRARGAAFAGLALVSAALAASAARGYADGLEAQLGELRPVVVATQEIRPDGALRPRDAARRLGVRRVPARFVPPDALADPVEAVGLELRARLPAGAYVTAAHLRAQPGRATAGDGLPAGSRAVEIAVAGATGLAAAGNPVGRRFDVVATAERGGAGSGRTRVIARGLRLLALGQARGGPDELATSGPATWTATLAAGRAEALRLIEAHNYAREVRLIAVAGGQG